MSGPKLNRFSSNADHSSQPKSKRNQDSDEELGCQTKKKKKWSSDESEESEDSSSSSSSSSKLSSSSSDKEKKKSKKLKKKLKKKIKKLKKKQKSKEKKLKKQLKAKHKRDKIRPSKQKAKEKEEEEDNITVGPIPLPESQEVPDRSRRMAPMTKEEWEKKQSVVRRVYDEATGRHRLIKGDGEVIEEIVSKQRHQEINRQATHGDGTSFQNELALKLGQKAINSKPFV